MNIKKKILTIAVLAACFMLVVSGCNLNSGTPKIYNLSYSTDEDYLVGLTDSVIGSCVEVRASSKVGGSTLSGSGSGVIIHADKNKGETYILTNSHVVTIKSESTSNSAYSTVQVTLFGETSPRSAEIVTRSACNTKEIKDWDKSTDLALLKIKHYSEYNGQNRAAALYSGALKYGQHILAIGNGHSQGTSVCDGLVSNPSVRFTASDSTLTAELIQISAGINPGNSGGPLFDMKGRLVGINTSKLVAYVARGATGSTSEVNIFADNISFSLPVSNIAVFMKDHLNLLNYWEADKNGEAQ